VTAASGRNGGDLFGEIGVDFLHEHRPRRRNKISRSCIKGKKITDSKREKRRSVFKNIARVSFSVPGVTTPRSAKKIENKSAAAPPDRFRREIVK
jgi:hypothetical protein